MNEKNISESLGKAVASGLGQAQAMRENLLGRVRNQLYRAENEARRAEQLRELHGLLEKNPDVARILDLIDETFLRRA